jgi:hypothetical protein
MAGVPPVQANTSGGSGGSTTNTQNFTTHVTAGNLLVLYVFDATDATTVINSIAWVGGNSGTFTLTASSPVTLAGRRLWCYTAQITASTGTGVTITFSASINSIVIFAEYAGMATSNAIDGELATSGTGTAISSGSMTPGNANDTIVGGLFVTTSGGGTLTPGSGFVLEVNNASTSHRGLEDKNVNVVASYAVTATYSSSQTWIAHMLALKQAVTTPTVATPTVDKPAGTYTAPVTVTISNATPGAVMCYRTDGVDPAATTPGVCDAGSTTYSGPVTLPASATLKVLGTEATYLNSAILAQAYVVRAPATFYVSNAGNDASNGTSPATSWAHAPGMNGATGIAASTVLAPGDTVLLNRGDSWLNTTLTVPVGGAAGSQITLSAYGTGAKPVISGAVNTPAITATAANMGYWTIDNIDVRSSGTTPGINTLASIYHNYWAADMLAVPGWIIQNCNSNAAFYLSGPNTVVRSNVLDGTANSNPPMGGIVIRGQLNTSALVDSNVVSHFKDRGIWVMNGATNPTVRNNTVHDILAGTDDGGMGINLDGANIPVTGARTTGNVVYACAGIGITHENSQGSKASYNLVHDCVQGGIDVINYAPYQVQATNLEISYNVIYNTNIGIPIWDAQTLVIVGNTIYNGTGAASQAFGIQSLDTNVAGLTFENNVIGGVWTHPVQVRTNKAVWTAFDYNDIVPSGTEVVFQFSTSTSQTLAQLQALGLMTHGITLDPKLASPPADLSLAPGSPAIGTGVDLGVAYQQALLPSTAWPSQVLLGTQAPGAWNMGAYLVAASPLTPGARYRSLRLTAGAPVQVTGASGFLAILNTGPGNLYLSTGATPGANTQSMLIPVGKSPPVLIPTSMPVWLSADQDGGVSIAVVQY